MNRYLVELTGCGGHGNGHKQLELGLTAEDARRLSEWSLDGLDRCGGPLLSVTPIKNTEK